MGIVTCGMTVSLDGFTSGENQSFEKPFGDADRDRLMAWVFAAFAAGGSEQLAALTSAKAYVMGRNMFGPDRGDWDLDWHGWWGEEPPYHGPVFVLSHHARAPLEMAGGTTFFFVTDGPESALAQARESAAGGDVDISGGAQTVRQYLRAGQIDRLMLSVVPMTIGAGERLFDDVGDLRMKQVSVVAGDDVTHVTYERRN